MATNRPPTDVNLIAVKASLIIRRDLHPALQYLLLRAATEIHSAPELFQRAGEFPAAERGDLRLSDEAREFHKTGAPFLHRYLPFWLAVLASRLLLLLIPVGAIAYPLLSQAPTLYKWSVMRRIVRMYGELKLIEAELESGGGPASRNVQARLERLEQSASHLQVPVSFAQPLYQLRAHIELVRNRVVGQLHPDTVTDAAATERLKVGTDSSDHYRNSTRLRGHIRDTMQVRNTTALAEIFAPKMPQEAPAATPASAGCRSDPVRLSLHSFSGGHILEVPYATTGPRSGGRIGRPYN